jgi:chromosome segregation ATPase
MKTAPSGSNSSEAGLDFRKVFVLALLIGLCLVGYSQYTSNAPLSIFGPLLVMAIYWAIGIRYAETGERVEQFADSLYFLGFLFTLIALTFSLLAFRSAEVNINLLIANFAMALVTTVFGLTARIVIMNFRDPPNDRNTLQDILDLQTAKLVRTASRISRELESVSREIVEHHKARMDENALRIETAHRALESLSEQAAGSVQRIADAASIRISQTLGELRDKLESAVLVFERVEQRIEAASVAMNGFQERLEIDRSARQKLVELAQAMSDIVASSTSLTRELHQQTENSRQIMSTLNQIVGQMNRIPAEVDVTTAAIRQSTHTLIKSSTALASHSGTVREHLDGFSKDLGDLHRRFGGLDLLATRIDQTADSLASLVETLHARSGSLIGLEQSAREQLELIGRHQRDLQRILAESRAGLEAITNHFVRAVEYVTEKLRA